MGGESKFSYKPDIPASLRAEIEKLFSSYEWLIPAWCELVNIHWDSKGDGDDAAQATSHFNYRWATISLFPMFWDQSEENKVSTVIHELLHIAIAPLADYARATFEIGFKEENSKLYQHAEQELDARHEGVIQDLTRIIMSYAQRDK